MTDDQILDERARLYAREAVEATPQGQARCLQIELGGRRWLFPEQEVSALLPPGRTAELPPGVRWGDWPCQGLLSHSLAILPLFCWSVLTGAGPLDPSADSSLLVVSAVAVALRVPGPVDMVDADLSSLSPDDHPWSLGLTPKGRTVANLARLHPQGGA
jgi:hypothetical protein